MIYDKSRYIAPYSYLINKDIREYDLEKANISILRENNLISDEFYNKMYNANRDIREYTIGCLRRDNKEIEEGYQLGILEARKRFFEINEIDDEIVLYIDNDSITIISDLLYPIHIQEKISNYLNFRLKKQYTSFYRLYTIDFLYYNNNIVEQYRLKNVREDILRKDHQQYFLDILLSLFYSAQTSNILDTIKMIQNIYDQYTKREMNYNYYREFNQQNQFKVIQTPYYIYYSDIWKEEDKNILDISYNADLLIQLYKIYMNEYINTAS